MRTHESIRRRGGFSLVEVLLSLLILAIGLLGLGAVIPAVVGQQRNATNTMQGTTVAESAVRDLRTRPDLNRLDPNPPSGGGGGGVINPTTPDGQGWGVWVRDEDWSDKFTWAPADEYDLTTGDWTIGENNDIEITIPVSQRLWPRPSTAAGSPRFVWDIVGRRVAPANQQYASDADEYDPDLISLDAPQIELAIFVRRIDSGIRAAGGLSLWEVLTGEGAVSSGDRRVPVGVDENGQPTLNGLGDYSAPVRLDAEFKPDATNDRRDVILLKDSEDGFDDDLMRRLASQPGQKLVDNMGNIYTVDSVEEGLTTDNIVAVVISPSVPSGTPPTDSGSTPDYIEVHQVVFTPQVPAAVRVVRISVKNPDGGV